MLLPLVLVLLLLAGRCSRLEAKTRTETGTGTRTETGTRTRTGTRTGGDGVRRLERESRSQQGLEGRPRDPRHKEVFIKHLTGPLSFSPKCRKHLYRLYHNTRDCTTPEYYRRCARLLTRLAKSSRCSER